MRLTGSQLTESRKDGTCVYRGRALRPWLWATVLPLLWSCDNTSYYCSNCVPPPSNPSEVSLGLVAGNFNNNGSTSVVATSTVLANPYVNSGNLKLYLSSGTGTFAPPVLVAAGNDPLYLASADLNNDMLPDVVSASFADGALSVFLNSAQTPGTFAAPLVLNSPGASQVAILDMNNDGLADLVSADYNVSLFLQSSPGVFAKPVSLYPGGANWVALGDLNHDGIADVAVTDAVGVKVLLHTGAASSSTYAAPVSVFTQTLNPNLLGANLIAIADVNNDGYNDLIITDPGPPGGTGAFVAVLLQDAAHPGQFLAAVNYPMGQYVAQSLIVSDVNGDHHPDIIIGGQSGVSVLLQDASGNGTFGAATNYAASDANEIAVADVNGDGRPDIIVGTGPSHPLVNGVMTNTPGVLLQNASRPGTFAALVALP